MSTAADVAAVAAASLLPPGDEPSLPCVSWWYSADDGGSWPTAASSAGPWSRRIPLNVCPPMLTAVWYASSASGSSTAPIRTHRNTASTLSSGGNLPPLPPSPEEVVVATMAEVADGKRPRERTSSRGRLLAAAAAAALLLAAPRKRAASCCWRSRRLAAGTQVLLTWVGQLNPRLRQHVRHRMWAQSFFALLPQSWQLVPALPPPAPAPPNPPPPSWDEKPSTTPVATPEEKNCDV
uniref:Uncharacterized protein n=1 Tax=Arundo donax TaxID=35708 RepID=A0A0A9FCQ8_ARUDO